MSTDRSGGTVNYCSGPSSTRTLPPLVNLVTEGHSGGLSLSRIHKSHLLFYFILLKMFAVDSWWQSSKSPNAWLGENLSSIWRHLEKDVHCQRWFHCVLSCWSSAFFLLGISLLKERISLTFRCQGTEAQASRQFSSHWWEFNAFGVLNNFLKILTLYWLDIISMSSVWEIFWRKHRR